MKPLTGAQESLLMGCRRDVPCEECTDVDVQEGEVLLDMGLLSLQPCTEQENCYDFVLTAAGERALRVHRVYEGTA